MVKFELVEFDKRQNTGEVVAAVDLHCKSLIKIDWRLSVVNPTVSENPGCFIGGFFVAAPGDHWSVL